MLIGESSGLDWEFLVPVCPVAVLYCGPSGLLLMVVWETLAWEMWPIIYLNGTYRGTRSELSRVWVSIDLPAVPRDIRSR